MSPGKTATRATDLQMDLTGAGDPDTAHAERWYAALTGLGVMVVAAADLQELHDRAAPMGCPGCRVCQGSLALLRRVIAAAQSEVDAPSPGSDPASAATRLAGGV